MLIELAELGPPAEVALTLTQGRMLAGSGVVTARPSPFLADRWEVAAAGKVGAVRVGNLEIHIRAKLPVARLMFLAGYAEKGAAWRADDVSVAQEDDLVPALAHALWRRTDYAISQGLLPGYVVVEETSPVLRGRLLESDQLHRHLGRAFPLEIRHDEFTVDIAENKILRTACERMLAVPRVDEHAQRMLRRLLREFSDVTPLARNSHIPEWQPTRLNTRYQAALRLAELVLRATSVEHGPGGVAVTGFLLDMPLVFEEFVTVALREALESANGGQVVGQDRDWFLDEAKRISLRPDVVWYRRGAPAAVADTKYKAESPAGYPNADIYQMLAYCTALKLPCGHLIYAKGAGEAVRHEIRETGISVLGHAVDLDSDPADLLDQVRDIAGALAETAPSARCLRRPIHNFLSMQLVRGKREL
jgi:5-methylcytosine-specific restriction enzyme subunit McrC